MTARRCVSLSTLLLAILAIARPARAEDACKTSFESAQELRLEGKLLRARDELRLCAEVCSEVFASACERWLGEVEPTIARATIVVVDAEGRVVPSTTVSLDGTALPLNRWQTALELDPGTHMFDASAPGMRSASVSITLKPGERRRVELTLLGSTTTETEEERPTRWPWWLLGGGGVALAAAGLVTVGVGHATRSEYEASCPCDEATALQRRDEVRSLWITGGILAGAGALATGIATVGLTTSARSAPAKAASISVRVAPAGLLVQGSF